jgi:hypothetical protein
VDRISLYYIQYINSGRERKMQAYYTVYVYKHTGIGQEFAFENVLADSVEDAIARVKADKTWLRTNPMHAFKQGSRR